MRTVVDPRFAARRIEVREGWARRRLRWIVVVLFAVLVGAIGYAVLQSPWLAVRSVSIEGASNAAVDEILDRSGVFEGMPTVAVRAEVIEDALKGDPWIAQADVVVTWPGSVEVRVLERKQAAWVRTTTGWALAAFDGTLVTSGERPTGAPALLTSVGTGAVGDVIDDQDVVGAVTLLGLLPPPLAAGATAEVLPGGIEANIGGHRVLFGNGRDIADKMATAIAMLEGDTVEPGAVVNVISPTRPGTNNPQPSVEGDAEEVSPSEESG